MDAVTAAAVRSQELGKKEWRSRGYLGEGARDKSPSPSPKPSPPTPYRGLGGPVGADLRVRPGHTSGYAPYRQVLIAGRWISTAGALWVRAPMEMKLTPVAATFGRRSLVPRRRLQ